MTEPSGSASFSSCLADSIRQGSLSRGTLSDSGNRFTYDELESVLDIIHTHFQKKNLNQHTLIALECPNTVYGALVLLCLLWREYSFLLLPPSITDGQSRSALSSDVDKLPMCKYVVRVRPLVQRRRNVFHLGADEFIDIIENSDNYVPDLLPMTAESPKVLLKTSGSICASKLVIHSNHKLLANALACAHHFQFACDNRVAIPVPIFHMYGLAAGLLPAVLKGCSVDIQSNTNVIKYLERQNAFEPDTTFLTPSLCEMLLAVRSEYRYNLVVTAGDRIRADVFRRFDKRHGTLVNLYGSTELGAIAAGEKDDPVEIRAASIGKGLPGVRIRVVPPNASGANGEVLCKHSNGFEGYFIGRSTSAEGGIAEAPEWLPTGDFGRLNRDGYLDILGRKDHTVNRDGVLVVLREIEGILEGIVGVKRAVIVVKPGARRGAYLFAVCVPDPDSSITADTIRQQCFDLLPRYAVPDSVRLVDNIPTLPSGKVDRRKLELCI